MSLRAILQCMFISVLVAACGPGQDKDTEHVRGPVAWPQVLNPIHTGAKLTFSHPDGYSVQVGMSMDVDTQAPDSWLPSDALVLPAEPGFVKVFAKMQDTSGQESESASWTFELSTAYPPPAGQEGSDAIAMDDERIAAWATEVAQVDFGQDVDEEWTDEQKALGPAQGTSTDILCLGRGGSAVLQFSPPIADGAGYDFAVFENGINDSFLELASVEVSSDGKTFVGFASAYLGTSPVDAYGSVDTTQVGGLAGKYRAGFGTPFDLHLLEFAPQVLAGKVDLKSIKYVRLIDVVGDGNQSDSFGHPIYDPYPTKGSAGFDLDAIAVLNQGH